MRQVDRPRRESWHSLFQGNGDHGPKARYISDGVTVLGLGSAGRVLPHNEGFGFLMLRIEKSISSHVWTALDTVMS